MKTLALAVGALLSLVHVSQACDLNSIQGTWSSSKPDCQLVDTGTTSVWSAKGDELTAKIQLTDDLTATGAFGPYIEKVSKYKIAIDPKTCALTATWISSSLSVFRRYGEPSSVFTGAVASTSEDNFTASLNFIPELKQMTVITDHEIVRTFTSISE